MNEIIGVSWDFWDTLFAHSDEEEVKNVDSARAKRLAEVLQITYDQAKRELKSHHSDEDGDSARGMTVESRLEYLSRKYSVILDIPALAKEISLISLKHNIKLVQGVEEALKNCGYRSISICNTKWTQGSDLKNLMIANGITSCFENCYFSDMGAFAKPSAKAFQSAWQGKVDLSKTVHIGDNLEKDIKGAINIGAKSIICRVIKRKPNIKDESGDAVIYSYDGLHGLLALLSNKRPDGKWKLIGIGNPKSRIKRIAAFAGNERGNVFIGDDIPENSEICAFLSERGERLNDCLYPAIYNFKGDLKNIRPKDLLLIDFVNGLVFKKND